MTADAPPTDAETPDQSPRAGSLRRPAEIACADELAALAQEDHGPRPAGWRLSPRAVVVFLLGRPAVGDRPAVTPKYYGPRRVVETAVATLVTDRALLLVGPPGVAKSRVSEHLAAAISGDSGLLIQGTAGLDDSHLRYGWNYAELLARGPSPAALTPTAISRGLESGRIARIEELTRIAPETQDALISILSEKTLAVPELGRTIDARPGFNVIATANLDDRGVHPPSAALRRRFNIVALPAPSTLGEEAEIVSARLAELGAELPSAAPEATSVEAVVRAFRELRRGRTEDGALSVRRPSGALSTADAIAALLSAWAEASYFDDGRLSADHLAGAIVAAAMRDGAPNAEAAGEAVGRSEEDAAILRDYAAAALGRRPEDAALRAALERAL